jgi:hypothetical protein
LKSWNVDEKCGYFALSHDSSLLAIGVLKEDKTIIFDFPEGELLINLRGGGKNGFFGQLSFVQSKNLLIELRVTAQDNRGPKKSICRLWNLGFKESEAVNDNDEDDEVETKLWEFEFRGFGQLSALDSENIFINWESHRKIDKISFNTGEILRSYTFDKWSSKCVMSSDLKLIAVSHFGCCSVLEGDTFECKGMFVSPIADDRYPLVPLSFIDNNKSLVCRINYNMTLVLFSLLSPLSGPVVVRNVGGTISDSMAICPLGLRILCYPYGSIEAFDLSKISALLIRKVVLASKWTILALRKQFIKRTVLGSVSSNRTIVDQCLHHLVENDALDIFILSKIFNYLS